MNVAGGTLAIRSKIAVLGIVLLAVIAVDARAQDAITVAVGGRGIGESCVTEIGEKAGRFARHGLKLDIVYTDGGGETQQAVVSNSAQIGVTSGLLGAFSLYSKGAPVRVIGASYTGGRQVFWYVPASSSITRPQDLNGKTVAYSNNSSASHVGLSWPCKSTSRSHSNRHQQATRLPP
jgi:NitT/TauT family transport system substrate-binding protein